jgi:hypothetical protein
MNIFEKGLKILKLSEFQTQKAYFYIYKSNLDHFEILFPAAIVVATKSTELKLRDILNVFHYLFTERELEINSEYWELRDGLISAEGILLRAIGFQIEVDNLMLDLYSYCDDHRIDRLTWQTAIAVLNDAMSIKEVVMKSEIVDGRSDARLVTMAVLEVAKMFVDERHDDIDHIRNDSKISSKERTESSPRNAHNVLVKAILNHLK